MRIGKTGLALILVGCLGCSPAGNPPFLDAEPIKQEKAKEQLPYKQAIKRFIEIAGKLPDKEKITIKEENKDLVKGEFHSPDYCLKIEQKKKIPIQPMEYRVELTTLINDEENKLAYSNKNAFLNINLMRATDDEQYILLYVPTGKDEHTRISMVLNRKTCDTKTEKNHPDNAEEKRQLLGIFEKIKSNYFPE